MAVDQILFRTTVEVVENITLFTDDPHEYGLPGDPISHRVYLTNHGNAEREVTLTVEGDVKYTHLNKYHLTLQPGNECLYSFECVDGAYCAADRKCKAFPKRDQECEAYICAPGLFCDPRDGRCEDQKGSGQECWDDTWCNDGLYCQFDEEGDGTCMGLKSLGVGCKGHYQCESMFCIPGLCQDGGELRFVHALAHLEPVHVDRPRRADLA